MAEPDHAAAGIDALQIMEGGEMQGQEHQVGGGPAASSTTAPPPTAEVAAAAGQGISSAGVTTAALLITALPPAVAAGGGGGIAGGSSSHQPSSSSQPRIQLGTGAAAAQPVAGPVGSPAAQQPPADAAAPALAAGDSAAAAPLPSQQSAGNLAPSGLAFHLDRSVALQKALDQNNSHDVLLKAIDGLLPEEEQGPAHNAVAGAFSLEKILELRVPSLTILLRKGSTKLAQDLLRKIVQVARADSPQI
jgi:hypothetical protein